MDGDGATPLSLTPGIPSPDELDNCQGPTKPNEDRRAEDMGGERRYLYLYHGGRVILDSLSLSLPSVEGITHVATRICSKPRRDTTRAGIT